MTKYYSNKADFESGSGNTVNKGSSYLNFGGYGDQTADSQVTSLLLDIELVTEVVQEEGVSDQYKPVGDATLGKDMPPNTFITSFNRAKKLLDLAKRVHGEVLERIDGKFTKGIDESLKSLNKVNGSDKPYKTKNLTYKKTQSFTDNYGEVHYYQQTETYKLSELLDQKASPIESTQKVYKEKLKQFRERINTATDMSAKEIAKYKKMSDKELMSTFYHGQISNYSGLKQFKWQEDNKGWLEPIEQHLGIGLFVVSAVATLFSAGITSPTLGAAASFVASTSGTMGTTYSILENGYSTITGNTLISGTALDFDDRVWAAAEAFATVSSFGVGKAFKFAGAADDTLAKVAKTKGVVEDTVHLSHISYNAAVKGEDPTLSLVTFAGGKAVKNISKRVEAKWKNSGSQNGNIDEVTSPKDLSTIKGKNVDTDVPVKPHVDVETSKIKPVEVVAGAATVVPKSKTPDIDVLTKSKDLSTIKGEVVDHVGTVKPKVELDVPEVKDVHDVEIPKYNKEQIIRNIEESKLARESSNFDQYLAKEKFQKTLIDMDPMDRPRYLQWHDYAESGLTVQDRVKLLSWDRPVNSKLYLKNKAVYDNPKYFDQLTGNENWPGQKGDPNIDGFVKGEYQKTTLSPGDKIDRFGSDYGQFFGNIGESKEMRAMSPNSDFKNHSQYEILMDLPVLKGKIAPWFDQPGGGIQFKLDPSFVEQIKAIPSDETAIIKKLIELGYLRKL